MGSDVITFSDGIVRHSVGISDTMKFNSSHTRRGFFTPSNPSKIFSYSRAESAIDRQLKIDFKI